MTAQEASNKITPKLKEEICELARPWKNQDGNLIMILHEIQGKFGYVPREASLCLSEGLNIPLAKIYEVLTFYHYFKLTPPGKKIISVCMGTACYLKGAPTLIKELTNVLKICPGEPTTDDFFQMQIVRCLGCCGLAPVLTVNNKVYGGVKPKDISNIISHHSKLALEEADK